MSTLTFGALAQQLDIADRTIVYYFPWKAKLVEAVVDVIVGDVMDMVTEAIGEKRLPELELLADLWTELSGPRLDQVAPAFVEIVGLAAAGRDPYRGLVARMFEDRQAWLASRIETSGDPRAAAGMVLAALDGLMAQQAVQGADASAAAVSALTPE